MKARRQQAILELVSKDRLASQHEIRERLASLGVEATQSTISRDIEELGLAKIHDQRGLRYVTPGALKGSGTANGQGNGLRQNLRRLLQEYALAITPSGNLLVIHTPPGAAHLLGEGIDRYEVDDVVGTVAGDNTILVIAREGAHARNLKRTLETIMEENGS